MGFRMTDVSLLFFPIQSRLNFRSSRRPRHVIFLEGGFFFFVMSGLFRSFFFFGGGSSCVEVLHSLPVLPLPPLSKQCCFLDPVFFVPVYIDTC